MESSESYLEISSDIVKNYRDLNNNTSDINLTFITDSTGFTDRLERWIEISKNNENDVYKEEIISESLKSLESIEFLRDSSSIKPNLFSSPKIFKFPIKEIEFDSLPVEVSPLKLDLQFSKKVENLIIHDTIFRKLISEIERSLNLFIKLKQVKLENRIFFEEDWEIPDYEKLILSLNFKGIPFKQEMLMWKMINTLVYERIKSMILYNSNEKGRRIKELKKNFFIKLEM